ncbi:serine hydrolase domain-containing protein [Algoriphagus mannitolivorans]|uniref:serine hydrolase domain-containing protein n=1 Tax=Algoriphagus mannitolivorans TaxID=226504 RepID=UPI00047E8140|nr:serine hydrolase domain-containing protein [Algoriphagus mannitolivorans]
MNQKIKYLIYGLVFWFLLFLIWEWSVSYPKVRWSPVPFPTSAEEKIDSTLTQSLSEFLIPGMAVGVVQEGKITYLKAIGYRNLETKDTFELQSTIPVASVSKIFTSLCAANYFLNTDISLSSSIQEVLPGNTDIPEFLSTITLEQLLRHQSGLEDPGFFNRLFQKKSKRSLEKIYQKIHAPNSNHEGEHYADINFDLLGFILQTHSQTPFDSLAKEHILKKSGMPSSYFLKKWPEPENPMIGHGKTFFWKRIEPKIMELERLPSPSSGLLTTPEDLSMALIHLSRGNLSDLNPALTWLKGDQDTPAGFQKFTLKGMEFLGHFGAQAGYSSLFAFSKKDNSGFFILTNARDFSDHRIKIASTILEILDSN